MQEQVLNSHERLNDWIDRETRHLDLIASWETLCGTYASLGFNDELSDQVKLDEFKWIIHETNKFLSRARTGLSSAKDGYAAMDYLEQSYAPAKNVEINSRKAVAFHKLRQQWIMNSLHQLYSLISEEEEETNE